MWLIERGPKLYDKSRGRAFFELRRHEGAMHVIGFRGELIMRVLAELSIFMALEKL